jgi:hypothetical protein
MGNVLCHWVRVVTKTVRLWKPVISLLVFSLPGLAFGLVPSSAAGSLSLPTPAGLTARVAVCAELATARSEPNAEKPQQADSRPQAPRSVTTIEQALTTTPQVIYEGGQLTIIAQNSSLADVLSVLRKLMGTEIELPAGATGERVWVQLGPGPASRVLRDLLDGTEFNYIIQASETDPDGIRSVSLIPRSKSHDASTGSLDGVAGQHPRVVNRSAPRDSQLPVENALPEAPNSSLPSATLEPDATAASPSPTAAQSAVKEPQSAPGTGASGASMPMASTADQMIQQLQSMYQQRRQIQILQNQGPAAPNQ